jgi:hypothetical protein
VETFFEISKLVFKPQALLDSPDNEFGINILFSQERHNYQDPVTEFLSCLYIDFDFDAAQKKLRECESVCF